MDLDRKDFALLEALQQNASQRLEDLASLAHLAPSSVHDRLRRLQREGVIKGWTINVDPACVGLGVLAFVGVSGSRPCSEVSQYLHEFREIEEAHSVAGQLCMILKVRVAKPSDLLALNDRLRQIPGIEKVETTIVLKTQIHRPTCLRPMLAGKSESERKGPTTQK